MPITIANTDSNTAIGTISTADITYVVRATYTNFLAPASDVLTFDNLNPTLILEDFGALISADTAAALVLDHQGTATITVNAGSNITSKGRGIDVQTSNTANFLNSGRIHGDSIGIATTGGIHNIVNYGEISGATAYHNFGGVETTTIENHGTMRGDIFNAIDFNTAGAGSGTVNNSGTITAVAHGIQSGSGTLTINNSGLILAGQFGVRVGGGTNTIVNYGEITGQDAYFDSSGSGTLILENHGTMRATVAVTLDMGDGNDFINNSGTLLGIASAVKLYNGDDTVINSGDIRASSAIFDNPGDTGTKTIVNTGTIATTDNNFAIDLQGSGPVDLTNGERGLITGSVRISSGLGTIVNSGTMIGQILGGDGGFSIKNFGTIYSPFTSSINLGSGIDTILNYGVIEKLVFLGGGADFYLALGGGFAAGVVNGGDGTDTLNGGAFADRLSGGNDSDILRGGAGDDNLIGGAGDDTMQGDSGDDTFAVDSANDIVKENIGGGYDTVNASASYTLAAGAEIEVLTNGDGLSHTLTGNEFAQTIIGGNAGDSLAGGGGADDLRGGAGNDTYVLGAEATGIDTVTDAGGIDAITSTISRSLASYATIEQLTLLNVATALNATGNGLVNILAGNSFANILDGGANGDAMFGGAGNDTYVVDNAADIVDEQSNGGAGTADRVISSINFNLNPSGNVVGVVENLTLTGAAVSGIGNAFANIITGNTIANALFGGGGNDTLAGGLGNDSLNGGAGNDFFVFNTKLSATNRDTITGFTNAAGNNDTFRMENAIFTKLGAGVHALNAAFFHNGATAGDANDYIVYNKATGALFYDANGNGAGGAIQFATLTNKPVLTASDFTVI